MWLIWLINQYIVIHSIKMFNRLTALFKTRSAKPTKETSKYRIHFKYKTRNNSKYINKTNNPSNGNKGHKAPFCQHKCSTSCYGWFSLFVQMELAIKRTDNVYPLKVQWQSIEEEYKERKAPDKESSPEWLNEDLVLRVLTFSFTSVLIYHFWWSVH